MLGNSAPRGGKLENSPPSAKLLVAVWDPKRATDVPGEVKVSHGSILNFAADADVLHPISLELRTAQQFNFQTDTLVADLEGGEPLPGGSKDEPLHAPSNIVLVKPDGSFQVCSELDDEESYRRQMYLEDEVDPNFQGYDGGRGEFDLGPGNAEFLLE